VFAIAHNSALDVEVINPEAYSCILCLKI